MTNFIEQININNSYKNIDSNYFNSSWVISPYMILDNASIAKNTAKVYSLASYLPNDSWQYEVIISGAVHTGSTKGNVGRLTLCPQTKTYSDIESYYGYFTLGRRVARTAAVQTNGSSIKVRILASDRNITISTYNATANSNIWLWASAYRRIGFQ